MKKFLFATTALVAFGAMVNGASAAEKISLSVGGYMEQWVGYADNSNDAVDGDGVKTSNAAVAERNEFDVQSDSEIYFKGATKLDNGLTVSVKVELEADDAAGAIDESALTVSGGFGQVTIGAEDNVGALIHSAAPDVGIGLAGGDWGNWIVRPSAGVAGATTNVVGAGGESDLDTFQGGDADANKVIYITPAYMGLQAGVSYTPSTNGGNTGIEAAGADAWVGGFAYNNKFGDVGVKADVGAYSLNGTQGTVRSSSHGYQGGINVSYMGFTVGTSALWHDESDSGGTVANANGADTLSTDGMNWDAGISYATGPYAVSLGYAHGYAEGSTANANDDETSVWILSGAYTMGPGVALKGSVFQVDYDDESSVKSLSNDGWGVVTGIRLDF